MQIRTRIVGNLGSERWGKAATTESLYTMMKIMVITQRAIQSQSPKRSMALERSIKVKMFGLQAGAVYTDSIYAPTQEFGAVIRPKRAKFLHFINEKTGDEVFTTKVTIPATHFFEKGMAIAEPLIMKELRDAGDRLAIRMGFFGI